MLKGDYRTNSKTRDDTFALCFRITIRNYTTVSLRLRMILDEIAVQLPRMHCKVKLAKMAPKFGLFFVDKNVRKYPLEWSYELQN